ncbi:Holliday junction resolvase RuvX [Acetohalobium arabaticum]|uniref:Resolvase RNase H domain protein fold protein n=1 Tax=Acetohalobium arabaticum (strain ATCC 49924 / DSM 5501 / Z-7288) TaxID=574087 RepID=D9QTU0_ACEAZ|nr:Holliday junction resolvase RuvX [Acetohalobium arabaticum]ADL13661.1 Resolvase RNase H domain protein fold protein [Acetohalobium arabaticum DSM 5501]
MILGIDPGRDKCGLALMIDKEEIEICEVVATDRILDRIEELIAEYRVNKIVIGDGTSSSELLDRLDSDGFEIHQVDETNSTLEARKLYWQSNPPSSWRRLVPTSFQTPPEAVDGYVAVILIRRYLAE